MRHQEVAEELQGATLVNPTVAAEGFQTTIIDAFVSQAAIVTYDVSSARVLQERGVPVRIVAKGDEQGLLSAVREEVSREPLTYDYNELSQWGWNTQTKIYESILQRFL